MTFNVGLLEVLLSEVKCGACGELHDKGLILRCQGCSVATSADCVLKRLLEREQANLPRSDA